MVRYFLYVTFICSIKERKKDLSSLNCFAGPTWSVNCQLVFR